MNNRLFLDELYRQAKAAAYLANSQHARAERLERKLSTARAWAWFFAVFAIGPFLMTLFDRFIR